MVFAEHTKSFAHLLGRDEVAIFKVLYNNIVHASQS